MPQLKYCYKTGVTFTEKVYIHHFLLRILPFENEAQRAVEKSRYEILPKAKVCVGFDAFGNKIITGYIDEKHDFFEFLSEGTMETYEYKIRDPHLNRLYLYPSKLTKPAVRIREIHDRLHVLPEISTADKVAAISQAVASLLRYEPGVTGIDTTAEEALSLGCGVCQDFSHLMISFCRLNGIPARYAAGFIEGEGFSHAWVEYYSDGWWYAFDPTHNRPVETAYIKIAQGRDYADCPLDKGVFRGLAQQQLDVSVKTEQ
ncbi:MAG: transglutaminase family protein [Dysgonamonadaceae bacterium]|jgi:transglutaminase-like putative cysteine protease|nr:transglutaminase family protein [Dysgonamonadaceae bacterium]